MEKKQYYSIRKLTIGASSVVIGALLFTGSTTAFASEESQHNISINYVTESELTDYEKSLIKQGIPEELKNGESYYLVYKNEVNFKKDKLPNTGSESIPLEAVGLATTSLLVVLVSKKNRNKILSIVLIGALGYSIVLPSSTFALENKILAGYNHILDNNSKFEDSILKIDGYKYVGYLTSNDILLESENEQPNIQESINEITPSDSTFIEEERPMEPPRNNIENKLKVKENLTDVVKNDNDNIPLPVVVEEVLSEITRDEEIEVADENNIAVGKNTTNKKISNERELSVDNIVGKHSEGIPEKANEVSEEEKSEVVTSITNDEPSKIDTNNDSSIDNVVADNKKTVDDNTNNGKTTENKDISNKLESINEVDKSNSSINTESTKSTDKKRKVKVTERKVKVTETIPYKVVYEEDENMENGTTKVVKEGVVGEKITIQNVVLNNDVELKREVTSSTITQKEVDKVIKVGTKGIKKSNNRLDASGIEGEDNSVEVKLIPKKETIYTEIVENKQRNYIRDYPKLEEATKEIKNDIGILTKKEDKLSMLNITNIFDDSLFEGEKRFENVMMYYVEANLKRKRELENHEEIIDTIISKQVPVITGVMRIGTRKQGFETLKGDGKLVNISSNLDEKEIRNIKLSNNNSYMLDKDVPGYLGSAVNVSYEKDFKNTKLGLKFDVENLKADSKPTIYNYDKKTQLFTPLKTDVLGNMVYANINKSGAYIVADKKVQDEKLSTTIDYIPNDSNIGDKTGNNTSDRKKIKKSVVFALDSSGSMSWNDGEGLRKKLTKEFIEKLNPENDKISIVDFDDKIHTNKPLTNNFNEVYSDIENVDDNGGTNIHKAIKAGIDILNSDKDENRKKYLFVLTDGKDDTGWLDFTPTENDYNKIIEEAKNSGIKIYTIGFKSTDEGLLKKIADKTGGKAYFKKEAVELPEIFDQLNEEIENNDTDFNKDGISAYYTKEILTGKLLLSTLKESPYFKNQIEKAREKVATDFGIDLNNVDSINKKIETLDDKYIEGLLSPDYDRDDLLNGNEARPEKNLNGKAFLYVLSDPENPDTDGDGIRDDKDGYTDLDKKDKNGNNKLEMTSNTEDADGDGYDDAFEKRNGIDSFGVKFDSSKWNVGYRDLLLFSVISYLKDNHENKIGNLKDIFKKENIDRINMTHFKELKLEETDKEFFEKWKFIDALNEEYDSSLVKFNSNVSWYYNENNKTLVIAYRGTDENNTDFTINKNFEYKSELINDLKILLNVSKIEDRARKQIQTIIDKTKGLDIENIYITGHSLGGYEAYYGALELSQSSMSSKFRGGINFNGPGIHAIKSNDIDKLNKLLVKSVYNDKISLNSLIVFGGLPSNEPLNKYELEYLEELLGVVKNENYKFDNKNIELVIKLFKLFKNDNNESYNNVTKLSADILVEMLLSANPISKVIDGVEHATKVVNTLSLLTKGILKHPKATPIEESYLKSRYTSNEDRQNEEKDLLIYSHELTSFFGKLAQGNLRTSENKFETSTNKINDFLNIFLKISAKTTGVISSVISPINESIQNVKKYVSNKIAEGMGYLKSIF